MSLHSSFKHLRTRHQPQRCRGRPDMTGQPDPAPQPLAANPAYFTRRAGIPLVPEGLTPLSGGG